MEWLQECDKNHEEYSRARRNFYTESYPLRLLVLSPMTKRISQLGSWAMTNVEHTLCSTQSLLGPDSTSYASQVSLV